MIFSYEEYYRGSFQFPIYQAIGSFLFLIPVIVIYIFLNINFIMTRFLVPTFCYSFFTCCLFQACNYNVESN